MIARLRPEVRIKDLFSSIFSGKDYAPVLEKELIVFFNVKKIIFTQSARAGLYFLFKSLPQKKVFIPSYTCWVVVEAALLAQKKVEFIDIRLTDYNMDIELLKKKITPDSIILATHQFGIPCDIEEILDIAKENNCYVIEDNAAAFGSEYKGKRTGGFAGAGVISFEMTKTLTCGRGGAILFNDDGLYQKTKAIYDSESKSSSLLFTIKYFLFLLISKIATVKNVYKFINEVFLKTKGLTTANPHYESKPDLLYLNKLGNGFIKLAKLNFERIAGIILMKKKTADRYFTSLRGNENITLPSYPDYKLPVFMRYPIRIRDMGKEHYYNMANKKGVDLAFTFPYSCDLDTKNSPNATVAAASVLNIPIYSSLGNSDIDQVVNVIKA